MLKLGLRKLSHDYYSISGYVYKVPRQTAYKKPGRESDHSPVDELIDHDDVTGLNLFPQGAAGCGHDDVRAALLFKGPDVRLVVDLGRHDGVLPPVPTGSRAEMADEWAAHRDPVGQQKALTGAPSSPSHRCAFTGRGRGCAIPGPLQAPTIGCPGAGQP